MLYKIPSFTLKLKCALNLSIWMPFFLYYSTWHCWWWWLKPNLVLETNISGKEISLCPNMQAISIYSRSWYYMIPIYLNFCIAHTQTSIETLEYHRTLLQLLTTSIFRQRLPSFLPTSISKTQLSLYYHHHQSLLAVIKE